MATSSTRAASDIATIIKHFPLDKPKDVPLEKAEKTRSASFYSTLAQEEDILGLEGIAAQHMRLQRQPVAMGSALRDLRKAIDTVIKGNPPLGPQRSALRDAAKSLELLAKRYDFLGGRAHENASTPDALTQEFITRSAGIAKVSAAEKQAQVAEMEMAVASLHASQAYNLRHEIIPLFRELAQSLRMRFNELEQGRS